MKTPLLTAAAAIALGTSFAHAATTIESTWTLGEGASAGLDTVGTLNPFNNQGGITVNTATPAGVAGSTAYSSSTGANFTGLWMFGAGATPQAIPTDNWGFQVMVRSTGTAGIATSDFRTVFGFKDALSGGLAVEAANIGGTVYWDVNRPGQANLITPRNATTTVTDGAWTNLALVLDGGTLKFFVNETLAGSIANNPGVTFTTDGLIALGLRQGSGSKSFTGDFDEARFFTFDAGQFNAATDLAYTAIPEPSTYGLLGAGAFGALVLARRRKAGLAVN